MSVPEQTPYKEYTANGSTASFALGFICDSKNDLIVLVDNVAPPVATWSLVGNNAVFTTAPASGKKIVLQRNTAMSRTTNYQSNNNSFRPETINKDIDRVWLKLQELGVADMLLKIYVDRLHGEQKDYIDNKDQLVRNIISDLRNHVNQQDNSRNSYFENLISSQGVSLQQLDNYYQHLLKGMADIAAEKGWLSSLVITPNGENQQQVNDRFENSFSGVIYLNNYKHLVDSNGCWDEAIKAAVNAAVGSTFGLLKKIQAPSGVIRIKNPSIFTYNSAKNKRGLLVEGVGRFSTVFYIVTEGTEKWFYNNGENNPKFDFVLFRDCGFTSDNAEFGNGFKIWSAGHEKAFVFDTIAYGSSVNQAVELDTVVGGLNQGWYFWGTGNADQTDWYSPSGRTNGTTITLENNQSVNFNIYGGTQTTYGSFLNIKGSGGGEFNMHGSHVTAMQHPDDTKKYYFLDIDDGVILGPGNNRFNFNGIRFEHRNLNFGLVKYEGDKGSLSCEFNNCNNSGFYLSTLVEAVIIGAQKKVTFRGGNLNEHHTYTLTSTSINYANGGVIGFEGVFAGIATTLDIPLFKRISIANSGQAYGRNITYGGTYSIGTQKVSDFDIGGGGARAGNKILKCANIKPVSSGFPKPLDNGYTIELPIGALVKSIYIHRFSVSGGSGDYQLKIGKNDKSQIYGESIFGSFNNDHKIDLSNLNLIITASNTEIRLWAEGTSSSSSTSGVAIIEYY